jgi:PHP family Zn ribbon phosphoesterase
MKKRDRQAFRMRACQRCGGDAYLEKSDEPEWRCLQCGRTVPVPAVVYDLRQERTRRVA